MAPDSKGHASSEVPTSELQSLVSVGLDTEALLEMFRCMVLARAVDEAERRLRKQQAVYFHISCAGHEAFQVAAGRLLKPGYDWFYPYYRDRALALAIGVSAEAMFLQAMGKATDPSSGGREMPSHFGSPELHIVNQSSPTGTQYLQAVGTAEGARLGLEAQRHYLSAHQRNGNGHSAGFLTNVPSFQNDEVVYVSGGEGSTSEGEFYEAVSLASLRKLPVLFAVEDNGYAISVPVEAQTPGGNISTLLSRVPKLYVEEFDGLDPVASFMALRRAIGYVRARKGPALVHAHVLRLQPHSDSDSDAAYRPETERQAEQERDPLPAFERRLLEEGVAAAETLDQIRRSVDVEIGAAVEAARAAPEPEVSSVSLHVVGELPAVVEGVPSESGESITMVEAIQRTLASEMANDSRIVVFGEDVADVTRSEHIKELSGKGGVFKATVGLQRRFGDHRVFNSPLAEAGIVGRALGLAIRGWVPVAEIQFLDYVWPAMHQIRNELSILRWRSNNNFTAPMVLRVPTGGYLTGGGPYHSQSAESIFAHCPGLRIVLPSNARDAAGLLRTALRCGDPVLFLEHKHLYRQTYAKRPDPGEDYAIPFGKASVVRPGTDVTVVTFGALVQRSLRAAEAVAESGLDVEVIDLRSLEPYDWATIQASVVKTNRVLVAYEDYRSHGFGAELAARIGEELFAHLDAPVERVAALDVPVAYSPVLEEATLPQVEDVRRGIEKLARF